MNKVDLNKIRKEQLAELRDAYSACLQAFHSVKHFACEKHIHEALFSLNRAIQYLEEYLNGQD